MTPDPIRAYCLACTIPMLGKPASGLCIICEMEAMPSDPSPPRKQAKAERRFSRAVLRGDRP